MLKVCKTPGPTACLKMLNKVCLKSCRKEKKVLMRTNCHGIILSYDYLVMCPTLENTPWVSGFKTV